MEQHPVPQPITSYEFRLVGDMTLKQFGKLASGVILALIVYGINPAPGILKWALIMLFTGLGVGMAFLPFQGRPLDTWIISFFKRIYSPTQYVWRMAGQLNLKPSYEQVIETPANYQPLLQTQPPRPKVDSPWAEDTRSKTDTTINNKQQTTDPIVSIPPISPITPIITTNESKSWHKGSPIQPPKLILAESKPEETPTVLYDSPQSPLSPISPQSSQSSLSQVAVGKTTIYSADSPSSPNIQYPISNIRKTVPPVFNPSLIIPTLPNIPNILGGFVKNTEGKLVEGAIIEVRDASLNPVRAFKTNKLGQFQIATPLPNGIYEIETEKDSLTFDIIRIELKGEILPPFEIIAKQT